MDYLNKKVEYMVCNEQGVAVKEIATINKIWKSEEKELCSFEENKHTISLDIVKVIDEN